MNMKRLLSLLLALTMALSCVAIPTLAEETSAAVTEITTETLATATKITAEDAVEEPAEMTEESATVPETTEETDNTPAEDSLLKISRKSGPHVLKNL